MALSPGSVVDDRYEIVAVIGAGGCGVVYEARQIQFERTVALKILKDELDEDTTARLFREAQALSLIHHRHVVLFYGYGVWQREPYIAVEYVKGRSLAAELDLIKNLSVERALEIFLQICEGLSCAHAACVVHRDLKPANVIITKFPAGSDLVKIIDFGLAKILSGSGASVQQLTGMGIAVGTAYYMSPEQCSGQSIDQRSDIYSLGCMLYECLTGLRPFDSDSAVGIMLKHLQETPPPLCDPVEASDAVKRLQAVLDRCMAKEPGDRYQTAAELHDDLQNLAVLAKSKALSWPSFAGRAGVNESVSEGLSAKKTAAGPFKARGRMKAVVAAMLLLCLSLAAVTLCLSYDRISAEQNYLSCEKYLELAKVSKNNGDLLACEANYKLAIFAGEKSIARSRLLVDLCLSALSDMYILQHRLDELQSVLQKKVDIGRQFKEHDDAMISDLYRLAKQKMFHRQLLQADEDLKYALRLRRLFPGSLPSEVELLSSLAASAYLSGHNRQFDQAIERLHILLHNPADASSLLQLMHIQANNSEAGNPELCSGFLVVQAAIISRCAIPLIPLYINDRLKLVQYLIDRRKFAQAKQELLPLVSFLELQIINYPAWYAGSLLMLSEITEGEASSPPAESTAESIRTSAFQRLMHLPIAAGDLAIASACYAALQGKTVPASVSPPKFSPQWNYAISIVCSLLASRHQLLPRKALIQYAMDNIVLPESAEAEGEK